MARILCKCGNTICDAGVTTGYLINQNNAEKIDEINHSKNQDSYSSIMESSLDTWECANCGSIAIFYPNSTEAHWYYPETKPETPIMELLEWYDNKFINPYTDEL